MDAAWNNLLDVWNGDWSVMARCPNLLHTDADKLVLYLSLSFFVFVFFFVSVFYMSSSFSFVTDDKVSQPPASADKLRQNLEQCDLDSLASPSAGCEAGQRIQELFNIVSSPGCAADTL